jgi:hypothetical protein
VTKGEGNAVVTRARKEAANAIQMIVGIDEIE